MFMRSEHPDILKDIHDHPKNKIDDAMRKRINLALAAFEKSFYGKLAEKDSID